MPSKGLFAFIFLLMTHLVFGADPLILDGGGIDGLFIGEYIEYLSEEELFPLIRSGWAAEKEFIEKVSSGHLSSDSRFLMNLEAVPGGNRYLVTLRDSGKSAAIQWGVADILRPDVRKTFRPSREEILGCDFTPHSCWLTFCIDNRSGSRQTVYLELDKYLFSSMDLFYTADGVPVEQRLDFTQPMAERRVKNRNMTAALNIPPGETSFIMRVDSWFDDIVPLRLWSADNYALYFARDNALLGLISGVFFLLLLYALFISFSANSRPYLYLSALTLCTFVVQLVVSGFGFQHLWPGNPATGIILFYGAFSLSMIFTLLFCRDYIPADRRPAVLDAYVFVLAGFIAVATAVMYAVPFSMQSRIFSLLFFLDHIYYLPLLIPAVSALKRKDRSGAFLLAALAIYAVSQAEWILTNRNVIPYSLVNYLNVKGLLFVMLMAAGLHYKFRTMSELIAGYRIRLEEISKKLTSKAVTDQTIRKIGWIKEFIKDNYREDIFREGLAASVDMSPDHLGRIFKKSVGTTLADFINSLRIRDAAEILLADREQKVIDVAFTVGFNSLRTFNKVFISTYHVTPTEFRKQSGTLSPTLS